MCFPDLPRALQGKCVNMPPRLLKQDLMEIVTDSGPTIRSIIHHGIKRKEGTAIHLDGFFTESYFQGTFVKTKILINVR